MVTTIRLSSLWQHDDRSEEHGEGYVSCSKAKQVAIPVLRLDAALDMASVTASFLLRQTSVRAISGMEVNYDPKGNATEVHFTVAPTLEASSEDDSFESDLVEELLNHAVANITLLHYTQE